MKVSTKRFAIKTAKRMSVALMTVTLQTTTMLAADVTVKDGATYYIYNVGQKKYLRASADGTVSLADAGTAFVFNKATATADSRAHATATTAGRPLYNVTAGSASLTLAITTDATDVTTQLYDQWAVCGDNANSSMCYLSCRTIDNNALTHLYYSSAEGAVTSTSAGVEGYADAEWMMVSEEVYSNQTVTLREDATSYSLPVVPEGATVGVNLYRKLVANVWNSFCVPFSISGTELKHVFGEDAKLMELTDVNDGVLHFSDRTEVVAGTPYLLRLSTVKAVGEPYLIGDVNSFVSQPTTITLTDGVTGYTCRNIASFYKTTCPKSAYVLNSDQLHHLQSEMPIGGFRGYFFITDENGTAKILSSWQHDETTTAVGNATETDQGNLNGARIYGTGGQLMMKPHNGDFSSLPHGTYIIRLKNGKTEKLQK